MRRSAKFAVALIIIVLVAILLRLQTPAPQEKSGGAEAARGNEGRRDMGVTGPEPLIYKLRLEEQRLEESEATKILDHFDHSPESLILVFFMTRDFSHLVELGKFKDNKMASTALAIYSADPNERLFWARNLLRLDPENGAASMITATKLLELGHVEEAMKMIAQVDNASFFNGNMEGVSALLPEVNKILPKGYTKALVFDDLTEARMVGVRSLFPKDFRKVFAGKKEDEILSLAKRYIAISNKVSEGAGFAISNDGIRMSSMSHECKLQRGAVLSALEKTLGPGSSLRVSSVSAQNLTGELTRDYSSAREEYERMNEEQMQEVVDAVLKAPTR